MSIFEEIGGLNPKRHPFNLTHEMLGNCDMGDCIPIFVQETVPGDIFKVNMKCVIRLQTLVAPAYQNLRAKINYFFVPYRQLWDEWEPFITGGEDGLNESVLPTYDATTWANKRLGLETGQTQGTNYLKYTFWDYIGLPIERDIHGVEPSLLPLRAYNHIYNEWYRDENLESKRDLDDISIFLRAWEKDYFTSALPFQQKGIAPSILLTGTGKAVYDLTTYLTNTNNTNKAFVINADGTTTDVSINTASNAGETAASNWKEFLENNSIDLSNVGTFDVNDLRNIVQLQKWKERNARGGTRYIEFLLAHFGEAPNNKELQRPDLFKSSYVPIIISEVTQTSETATTPLGTYAGQGEGVGVDNSDDDYYCEDYGVIIGIMSIQPTTIYGSQGMPRWIRRKTRMEQFYPEFVNLSEQAIDKAELCCDALTDPTNEEQKNTVIKNNTEIFGYQGRYDEMRVRNGYITSDMRDTLAEWHMARIFDSQPSLNSEFIRKEPSKRIFNAQKEEDKSCIFYIENNITAIRKLPAQSEPGLVDHN